MARRPLTPERIAALASPKSAFEELVERVGPLETSVLAQAVPYHGPTLGEWAGEKKKSRKKNGWNEETTRAEVREMIHSNRWESASPKHFVELYTHLHEAVYRTPPLELRTNKARMSAAALAARTLKLHFDSDPAKLAEFMRWVWMRAQKEVADARAGLREDRGFRISWRWQWSPRLVTDYRHALLTRKT